MWYQFESHPVFQVNNYRIWVRKKSLGHIITHIDTVPWKNKLGSFCHFRHQHFKLLYHPYRLTAFTKMLCEINGTEGSHTILGDFKPVGEVTHPAYYIHVVEKGTKQ